MRFRYVAYSLEIGVTHGQIEARTDAEALHEVVRQGYKPLYLKPAVGLPSREELFPSLFRVGTGELIRFSRSLAAMMVTGGNLLRILEMLQGETTHRVMRRTLEAIRRRLDEGGRLSEALADHPTVFSPLFVSVVEVGEHTGRLGISLDQMADMLEKEHDAKKKALSSMLYPVAIMGLAMVTMTFLMFFAMPPMLKVFDNMGTDIPFITRVVIGIFGFIRENILLILGGTVAMAIALALAARIPRVKYAMHASQVRAPVLGGVIVSGELARFSRTMSMLLEAEVPLTTALQLGTSGCKNQVIRHAFAEAEEGLLVGQSLTAALRRCAVLPTMFVELMMIGEESNSLRRTMGDAADNYQKDLERRLNGLLGLLEPASTLFVGGIVGLLAFSMFVPIYSGLNAFQ